MELIPASLIFRLALFSIKLTCVRVVQVFDQNKFSQNIIKRLRQSDSSNGFLPLPILTHFHTLCYVRFVMLLVIE